MPQNLAQGTTVTSSYDDYSTWLGMCKHWRVSKHLVVNMLIKSRKLYYSVQDKYASIHRGVEDQAFLKPRTFFEDNLGNAEGVVNVALPSPRDSALKKNQLLSSSVPERLGASSETEIECRESALPRASSTNSARPAESASSSTL